MIFRGTDTVAILLEWILARMILHPNIQAKAQSEIDSVVGFGRTVTDLDLPNLPYIRAIVKETLRMHPPGPLLSWARLSIHDTQIGHRLIPAGTTAMVNMWAITHDQDVWSNPKQFKPERFLQEDVPIMGSDLRLAPFGSGRRVCPGKAMGLATVELWLAMFLQSFKWMPCDSGVDLSECLKLSLEMKYPLVSNVIVKPTSNGGPGVSLIDLGNQHGEGQLVEPLPSWLCMTNFGPFPSISQRETERDQSPSSYTILLLLRTIGHLHGSLFGNGVNPVKLIRHDDKRRRRPWSMDMEDLKISLLHSIQFIVTVFLVKIFRDEKRKTSRGLGIWN
ncbi:hypothetical protein VNO77_02113 [Canavalia gladiata]|uniref:Uncharacterized protein n=1 Tax=Canavalia gladiata TaxID=3824 RepID=A0AAN9MSG1_CANGL